MLRWQASCASHRHNRRLGVSTVCVRCAQSSRDEASAAAGRVTAIASHSELDTHADVAAFGFPFASAFASVPFFHFVSFRFVPFVCVLCCLRLRLSSRPDVLCARCVESSRVAQYCAADVRW